MDRVPNQHGFDSGDIRSLTGLAISGLLWMFDSRRNLFSTRIVRTSGGLVRERLCDRDTLVAVLGLLHFENCGGDCPIDARLVLADLLKRDQRFDNLSDLGLLLWACAEAGPEFARHVCSDFDLERALCRCREGRQASTLGLAWFVSGLAHLTIAGQGRLREIAVATYSLLRQNQGEYGLFSHLAETGSLCGLMRGRVANFADQIFSVYGLAKFSQVFDARKAMENALDCALTLCELQGPLGQWWWHYDASTGRVVNRYPVYSVHQYALAPLALSALGEIVQSDFRVWIDKGMRWVFGDNELEQSLHDSLANVIWDGIARRNHFRHVHSAIEVLSMHEDAHPHRDLSPVWECRAADLGWLLLASAGVLAQSRNQFVRALRASHGL